MRTLTIEYGPGAGDFERTASGFDVVDEYGQRCNGLCLGEMLEQVVGLVVQGRARYQMLTPDGWTAQRAAMEQRMALARADDARRQETALDALQHLYGVFMQMSVPEERNRPTEADIQAALAQAARVIDRADVIPF